MIWVGSRVTEAIGGRYPRLGLFGRTTRTRVPYVALLFQFVIICILLSFDPQSVMNYVGSVLWFWSLLAVVGVIVLRFREPKLARPYRTWGYPVTPLIFWHDHGLLPRAKRARQPVAERGRHGDGADWHPDLSLGEPGCAAGAAAGRDCE